MLLAVPAAADSQCRASATAGGSRDVLSRLAVAGNRGEFANPVQDVPLKRVTRRKHRVVEVVGRLAGHAEPLHYTP